MRLKRDRGRASSRSKFRCYGPACLSSAAFTPYLHRFKYRKINEFNAPFLKTSNLGIGACINNSVGHDIMSLEVVQRDNCAPCRRSWGCGWEWSRRTISEIVRTVGSGTGERRWGWCSVTIVQGLTSCSGRWWYKLNLEIERVIWLGWRWSYYDKSLKEINQSISACIMGRMIKDTSWTLLTLLVAPFLAPTSSIDFLYSCTVSELKVGLGGGVVVRLSWLFPFIWSAEGRNDVNDENIVVDKENCFVSLPWKVGSACLLFLETNAALLSYASKDMAAVSWDCQTDCGLENLIRLL